MPNPDAAFAVAAGSRVTIGPHEVLKLIYRSPGPALCPLGLVHCKPATLKFCDYTVTPLSTTGGRYSPPLPATDRAPSTERMFSRLGLPPETLAANMTAQLLSGSSA